MPSGRGRPSHHFCILFDIVGEGMDWEFARTDKQLIERVYRDWTGRELPA